MSNFATICKWLGKLLVVVLPAWWYYYWLCFIYSVWDCSFWHLICQSVITDNLWFFINFWQLFPILRVHRFHADINDCHKVSNKICTLLIMCWNGHAIKKNIEYTDYFVVWKQWKHVAIRMLQAVSFRLC